MRRALLVSLFLPLAACGRGEPPAPPGPPNVAPLGEAAPSAGANAPVANAPVANAPVANAPVANAPATSAPTAANSAPSAAAGAAGETLVPSDATEPQTHDRPAPDAPILVKRAEALYQAIRDDAPDVALPFFFPVDAYKQVKDVTYPERDWKNRLVAEFVRDIHEIHRLNAKSLDGSTFAGLEVPDARARWVEPKEEYNKIGYFRVFGSKLKWEKDGRTRSTEVKSLISWRGQWYAVHLSAIVRKKEE
jgi:hypothetical protein